MPTINPVIALSLRSDLIEKIDQRAGAEFLSRAAWLRRLVLQAITADETKTPRRRGTP